jgi:hypothetical protein
MNTLEKSVNGYVALLKLCGVLWLLAAPFAIYAWIDDVGMIEHTVGTEITAKSDWFVGQIKAPCISHPLTENILGLEKGYAFGLLNL